MSLRGTWVAAFLLALGAVGALGGRPDAAAGKTARGTGYRIVLASDLDRATRGYTIRPDGSRLTPLLSPDRRLVPFDVSRDGRTIAYFGLRPSAIYVSRANGTRLRWVVQANDLVHGAGDFGTAALSPDGRMVAYSAGSTGPFAVVRTNGRGRRVLASGHADEIEWSPDGKALVYTARRSDRTAVVIQPLRGRRRVLARNWAYAPKWSPDGRWIAYGSRAGLQLVHPDGRNRHRVALGGPLAWSPDGRSLAGTGPRGIVLMGIDGRVSRRIRLPGPMDTLALAWAPGGRSLLVERFDRRNIDPRQIWIVGADGRGLRRVTRLGNNDLVSWTRLAPTRRPVPPLPPSVRVVGPRTVGTSGRISALSADGERVAFAAEGTAADCFHVALWTPATRALGRFARPAGCFWPLSNPIYDVELAGSRAAWATEAGCSHFDCFSDLESSTLGARSPEHLARAGYTHGDEQWDFHLRGDGDLLVFNERSRLVRIGSGRERCHESMAAICTTLRREDHAAPVDSVAGGLIAVREQAAVVVLDERGALVRVFPFGADEVTAARLDGGRLVVTRASRIEVYDVSTGAAELQRPLPSRSELVDVDGGTAVLVRDNTITLLKLQDGRTRTISPGRGPVLADLEPAGLYYSYATGDGGGRIVLVPRSEAEPA